MFQPDENNSPEKISGILTGEEFPAENIDFIRIYSLRDGSIKPADAPRDPQGKDKLLYFGPEERSLVEGFSDLVDQMELSEVLELAPDRTKPPKSLDRYRLAPLKIEHSQYTNSAVTAASRIDDVPGVKFDYNGNNIPPWLDTSFAIGLAYEGTLSAVASAHTTPEGYLRIAQIQAVAPPPDQEKGIDKFSSGLHGGFLWRHTLVRAWLQLAQQLGVKKVEILAASNNEWANSNQPKNHKRFLAGYDQVAQDLGFTKNDNGNWELPVDSELAAIRSIGRSVLDKQVA